MEQAILEKTIERMWKMQLEINELRKKVGELDDVLKSMRNSSITRT